MELALDRTSSGAGGERQTRLDLAAFYRLLDCFGWTDLIYNHVSARIPADPDVYLVNRYGLLFEEITASNLVKVAVATGQLVDTPEENTYNIAAHLLHGGVLAARPDLQCVAHVHTPAIMAVSAMSCGLLPITQTAMGLHDRIGYHDYGVDEEACARLADDFRRHDVVLLRNHGAMVGGRTIAEAFVELHNLQFACAAQVLAMPAGPLLQPPPPAVLAQHVGTVEHWLARARGPRDPEGCIEWDACLRLLARRGIDYAC